MNKTVFLGMSGGVDSSVSAVLLQEQGYHVVGVYMKNWSKDLPGMQCPWAEDLADAKRVAVKLDLDFQIFDFEAEYKNKVVDYMLAEFKKGNTPNPDIMCNQEIKFKLFYDVARERGADLIATGHYAQTGFREAEEPVSSSFSPASDQTYIPRSGMTSGRETGNSKKVSSASRKHLLRAVDENKDQTYFLYRISQDAINHTIFPIGHLTKPEVKKLAEKHGLDTAHKKESMGVCFVGEVGIKDFLKEYLPPQQPGPIQDADTHETLGYHDGAIFYTIGQRRGLHLGGGLPYYVVKKDIKNNIVYVSKNLNHASLWTDELTLKDVVLRNPETKGPFSSPFPPETDKDESSEAEEFFSSSFPPASDQTSIPDGGGAAQRMTSGRETGNSKKVSSASRTHILVRLRHRAPLLPATLTTSGDTATLHFESPIKRPAPGQSAVLYAGPDHQICIGGGIIV